MAGAGAVVFWVLGASIAVITVHAAFYNYDALEVPGDKEQLVGVVEEVWGAIIGRLQYWESVMFIE